MRRDNSIQLLYDNPMYYSLDSSYLSRSMDAGSPSLVYVRLNVI
jgi:hypothetical protein